MRVGFKIERLGDQIELHRSHMERTAMSVLATRSSTWWASSYCGLQDRAHGDQIELHRNHIERPATASDQIKHQAGELHGRPTARPLHTGFLGHPPHSPSSCPRSMSMVRRRSDGKDGCSAAFPHSLLLLVVCCTPSRCVVPGPGSTALVPSTELSICEARVLYLVRQLQRVACLCWP